MNNAYNINDNFSSNRGCHTIEEERNEDVEGGQRSYWRCGSTNQGGVGKDGDDEVEENMYDDNKDNQNYKSSTHNYSSSNRPSNSFGCHRDHDFYEESAHYSRKRAKDMCGEEDVKSSSQYIHPHKSSNHRMNAYNMSSSNNNNSVENSNSNSNHYYNYNRKGGRGGDANLGGGGGGGTRRGASRNYCNSRQNPVNITFDFSNQTFHCGSLERDTEKDQGMDDKSECSRPMEDKDNYDNNVASEIKNAKIYLPDGIFHSTVNVIGVLLGPKGAHHKKMESESKTSIQLYGKGIKNDNMMNHNANNNNNSDTLYLSVNYFHLKQLHIVYNFLDELIAKTYPEDSPIMPPQMKRPPELLAFMSSLCSKKSEAERINEGNFAHNSEEKSVCPSFNKFGAPTSKMLNNVFYPAKSSSTFDNIGNGVAVDQEFKAEEKSALLLNGEADATEARDMEETNKYSLLSLSFQSCNQTSKNFENVSNKVKTEDFKTAVFPNNNNSNNNKSSDKNNFNNNFAKPNSSVHSFPPYGGILPTPPRHLFHQFQNINPATNRMYCPTTSAPFMPKHVVNNVHPFDMSASFRPPSQYPHFNGGGGGGGGGVTAPVPPTTPPSSIVQALWTFHLLLLYVREIHVTAFNDTYVNFYGFSYDMHLFDKTENSKNEELEREWKSLDSDGVAWILSRYPFIFLLKENLVVSTIVSYIVNYEAFSDFVDQHVSFSLSIKSNNSKNNFSDSDTTSHEAKVSSALSSTSLLMSALQDNSASSYDGTSASPFQSVQQQISINCSTFSSSPTSHVSTDEFCSTASLAINTSHKNNHQKSDVDSVNKKEKLKEFDEEKEAKRMRFEENNEISKFKIDHAQEAQLNSCKEKNKNSSVIKYMYQLGNMEEIEEEEEEEDENEIPPNFGGEGVSAVEGMRQVGKEEEAEKKFASASGNGNFECGKAAYNDIAQGIHSDGDSGRNLLLINNRTNNSRDIQSSVENSKKLVLMTLLQSLHRMLVKYRKPINVNQIIDMFNEIYHFSFPLSLIRAYYFDDRQISSLYHFLQAFPEVFHLSRKIHMSQNNLEVINSDNNTVVVDATLVTPTYKPDFHKVVSIFIEYGAVTGVASNAKKPKDYENVI